MQKPVSFVALVACFALAASVDARGQDADVEAAEETENTDDPGDQDNADVEYYVVDEADDIWPDDPESEEDWAEEQLAEDPSESDSEAARVRQPQGLPLVEAVATGPAKPPIAVNRSFGGEPVKDAEAPWQAQIYYPNNASAFATHLDAGEPLWALQHYCGGTLVAQDWVLTAAHCIDNGMMRANYRVRLGQERIDQSGGWTYKIDRVVRYASYVPLKGGDIALIHIVNDTGHAPPPQSQVRPVPIFRGNDATPNEPVTAFGWGRTRNTGGKSNAILLKVALNILDRPTCDKSRIALIEGRVVCAKAPNRKTRSNDSGGPLINASKQLVGIVSSGGNPAQLTAFPVSTHGSLPICRGLQK